MFQNLLPVLQTFLAVGNLCIMLYALKTFLNKPHNTLEEKVNAHDIKIKDIEQSLREGNDKFREQDDKFKVQERTNKAFQSVMLSFVNFEIAYCLHTNYQHTEELLKAKGALEDYINDKRPI